ncbi:MAG: MBL fold metallo-hydrolase [Syntrophorhabdaceae bacterium]|nr:MBL fold metallo-hydrolase [Syntrophorhabdaceae bacterium]
MGKHARLRLTVLCENIVANLRGIGEHGFSVFVETEGGAYLFDTGSGIGILRNSLTFERDLRSVKRVLLSHGHYDHTGGLKDVLSVTGPVEVHCHPAAFDEKYAVEHEEGGVKTRFIGMPERRESLESRGADFRLGSGFREIAGGVYLTGEIPRLSPFETGDRRLQVKNGDIFEVDTVPDDGALVVSTEDGLVVLLGCAHAGMVNTLEHVRKNLPGEPIRAVIGGTHWGALPEDAVDASIRAVGEMDIGSIGVCHCTGMAAAWRLIGEMGKRCFYASVGTVFEV